ncbi:MAG TPA: TCR/Tet family MFS transporter [Vicinamibacterales bacterium]|nr:TCR/Tet family MFS transporter [Vicinamibacterales bacterium]
MEPTSAAGKPPISAKATVGEPTRAAVTFIFVTVLLDIVALGMIIPVLPKLIEVFEGGNTARAAETIAIFGTVWATAQFFASPILGALSDRFGRRPVILLSNLGLGLDYIVMALAPTLGWLVAGRIFSGVTSASIATAFAYVADVTTPEKRARTYGMMGAAFGIGFVIGPALGGVLSTVSPRMPFWFAAGFSLTNFLYGTFILPESLPPERRGLFSWKRANPVGSLQLLRKYPQLVGFASLHFLYHLAHQTLASVFVLYAGFRYGWSAMDVGLAMTGVGLTVAIVQGGLVGRLSARFGERRTLVAGLLFGAAGFAIYGLAPTGFMFAIGIPVMSLWGLYGPSNQALMTRRVGPAEQGRLQGALSSIMGITGIFGPALFSLIFAGVIGRYGYLGIPGAPFLLASALLLTAAVIAERLTRVP